MDEPGSTGEPHRLTGRFFVWVLKELTLVYFDPQYVSVPQRRPNARPFRIQWNSAR